MVTKVRGAFGEFTGELHVDGDEPTKPSGTLTVVARSIDTGNDQRDGHLRGNDFFDMADHPGISFASTGVEHVDGDRFKLTGDLTVKGITRPVTLDAEFNGAATDPFGNRRIGIEASSTINRKDWGITWNAALETGGLLVSDKITLTIDISAIKRA
jgi:polyisoprenoid-binding protein YceI